MSKHINNVMINNEDLTMERMMAEATALNETISRIEQETANSMTKEDMTMEDDVDTISHWDAFTEYLVPDNYEYKAPKLVWHPIQNEYIEVTCSAEMRNIKQNYTLDDSKGYMIEDMEYVNEDRLIKAEQALADIGVTWEKINRGNELVNKIFWCGVSGYADFRDDLFTFMFEDVIKNDKDMVKGMEAEDKIKETKAAISISNKLVQQIDNNVMEYAMAVRTKIWEVAVVDGKIDWAVVNNKRQEYSKVLLKKVINKYFQNKYIEKADYQLLASMVGTRYWQVVLGRTEEMVTKRYIDRTWAAVSEYLNVQFVMFLKEHKENCETIDGWTMDFDRQQADMMNDLLWSEVAADREINQLYMDMDAMEEMEEEERRRFLIANR